MKNRQYQEVQLSKKESELVQWLMKGEHAWYEAFYQYENRKKPKFATPKTTLKERSWFNKTLKSLHQKGLCKNVPFAINGVSWRNPGITSNKANFAAITLQQTNFENKQDFQRAIAY